MCNKSFAWSCFALSNIACRSSSRTRSASSCLFRCSSSSSSFSFAEASATSSSVRPKAWPCCKTARRSSMLPEETALFNASLALSSRSFCRKISRAFSNKLSSTPSNSASWSACFRLSGSPCLNIKNDPAAKKATDIHHTLLSVHKPLYLFY